MIKQQFPIWAQEEYTYAGGFGFVPFLTAYVHEADTAPGLVILPGGGYEFASPSESEIVAEEFYARGFNCFVLSYSNNPTHTLPLHDQPLRDAARAVRLLRSRAEGLGLRAAQIFVLGFSAGGHLAGTLAVHAADAEETNPAYAPFSARPDAVLLGYPVVTGGRFAHPGSFQNLLGEQPDPAELTYYSLEKQVTAATPPLFLWHTADDDCVSVENTYLLARACQAQGVPYALHIFTAGRHGLSLANARMAAGDFGDPYSLVQTERTRAAVLAGRCALTEEQRQAFLDRFGAGKILAHVKEAPPQARPEVAVWPELAEAFLKSI